jgi:hypothetical protein
MPATAAALTQLLALPWDTEEDACVVAELSALASADAPTPARAATAVAAAALLVVYLVARGRWVEALAVPAPHRSSDDAASSPAADEVRHSPFSLT